MKKNFRRRGVGACVAAAIGFFVGVAGCDSSDDGDGNAAAQCLSAAQVPSPDSWPYISECLGEVGEADTCEGESLALEWDGATLLVRHGCVSGSCGWLFDDKFDTDADTLTLTEIDTNDAVTGCSCKFNLAVSTEPAPGGYTFRVKSAVPASGNPVTTVWEEAIDLPDGESVSYCFTR